ncbi:MAG: GrpB family protein [Cyanothece sp. SIO2G6]|nr:GrpB family protein [Cyanothece sp. SIO2G6]
MRKIEVVPHNPAWQAAFELEARCVAAALGANVAEVYHIGSTSIPGIYAKPIIDLMVAVGAIAPVDRQTPAMGERGYEAMGEYGIPGRRYFRKDNAAGTRTHHVHVFEMGSDQIERHLAFRDYMRAHPKEARAYSDLKQMLAKAHPTDIEAYMDGKDGFIQAIDTKAALWRSLAF